MSEEINEKYPLEKSKELTAQLEAGGCLHCAAAHPIATLASAYALQEIAAMLGVIAGELVNRR